MSVVLENVEVRFPDGSGGLRKVLGVHHAEFGGTDPICLTGGSGSGKTTLLHVISGIVCPTVGSVSHGDTDITRLREGEKDRFRAARIGYVFQTFNLLQGLSGRENVSMAQALAGKGGPSARERCDEVIERVGMSARAHARPGSLSVGEQQRIAIARAVVNRPAVVLADEPTANLDEANGDAALDLLEKSAAESGALLIIVTHESRVMSRFRRVIPLAEIQS